MSYTDIIWSSCDKELLCRVLKLQKHAANQIILYADCLARFVTLIISWDRYRVKLTYVLFFYKCVNGSLLNYLTEHLVFNKTQHNRSMCYASYNSVFPNYKQKTEGGRFFAVSAARLWNNVPLNTRKSDSVKCLKTHLFNLGYTIPL